MKDFLTHSAIRRLLTNTITGEWGAANGSWGGWGQFSSALCLGPAELSSHLRYRDYDYYIVRKFGCCPIWNDHVDPPSVWSLGWTEAGLQCVPLEKKAEGNLTAVHQINQLLLT